MTTCPHYPLPIIPPGTCHLVGTFCSRALYVPWMVFACATARRGEGTVPVPLPHITYLPTQTCPVTAKKHLFCPDLLPPPPTFPPCLYYFPPGTPPFYHFLPHLLPPCPVPWSVPLHHQSPPLPVPPHIPFTTTPPFYLPAMAPTTTVTVPWCVVPCTITTYLPPHSSCPTHPIVLVRLTLYV